MRYTQIVVLLNRNVNNHQKVVCEQGIMQPILIQHHQPRNNLEYQDESVAEEAHQKLITDYV